MIRSFFARTFYRLINKISDTEMVDGARDFRLMTRQMVDAVLELTEYNRFSKGLFSWVGFKTEYISFENRERVAGETSWSFWKLFNYSIDGIINFSDAPLTIRDRNNIYYFSCAIIWRSNCWLAFYGIHPLIYRRNPIALSRDHRKIYW